MTTARTLLPRLAGALSIAALLLGCTEDAKRTAAAGDKDAGPPMEPRPVDVARPSFQAKSSTQLAKSVEACVGKGALTITESMVASEANPNAFLTADFTVGSDIIEAQKGLFDGQASALRTGVRVDQITLEYLTALKNVANVVGSRCAAGMVDDSNLCMCGTEAAAKELLARCLGAVADTSTPEAAALAKSLASKCETNPGSGIASMIASLAFAKVP